MPAMATQKQQLSQRPRSSSQSSSGKTTSSTRSTVASVHSNTQNERTDARGATHMSPSSDILKRTQTAPSPSAASTDPNTVVIHVYDQQRDQKQDFHCDAHVLAQRMRYFKPHLAVQTAASYQSPSPPPVTTGAGSTKHELAERGDSHHQQNNHGAIEITVHCDVHIFAWLIRYIKATSHPRRALKSAGTTRHSPSASSPGVASRGICKPPMSVANCFPILISSHFLKISDLVDECISYIGANFVAVCHISSDITALSDDLLTRISRLVDIDAMEAVLSDTMRSAEGTEQKSDTTTRADADNGTETGSSDLSTPSSSESTRATRVNASEFAQLIGRMYKHKITTLFFRSASESADEGAATRKSTASEAPDDANVDIVWRCSICNNPFSARHIDVLTCPKANRVIDYHGNVHCRHSPMVRRARGVDANGHYDEDEDDEGSAQMYYNTSDYVRDLRKRHGLGWRCIYWRLWGLVNHLACRRCGEVFPMRSFSGCKYHSMSAHFQLGESKGRYLCCGQVATRFNYATNSVTSTVTSTSAITMKSGHESNGASLHGAAAASVSCGIAQFNEDGCCSRDHDVVAEDDVGAASSRQNKTFKGDIRMTFRNPSHDDTERLIAIFRKYRELIESNGGVELYDGMHGFDDDEFAAADTLDETFDNVVDRAESGAAASSSSDSDSDDDDTDDSSDDDDTDDDTDDDERVTRRSSASRRARLARLEAVRDADEVNMIMLSLSLRRQREQQQEQTVYNAVR